MKRFCILICCLALLCSMMAQSAAAENIASGRLGEQVTYTLDRTTGTLLVEGEGATWDFASVPHGLEDMAEIEIKGESSPLKDEEGIRTIIISDGITRIGTCAFPDCRELQNVTIGADVQEIGSLAFNRVFRLRTVTLPKSIKKLETMAFFLCGGLESAVFLGDAPEFCYQNYDVSEFYRAYCGPFIAFDAPFWDGLSMYHLKEAEGWTDGKNGDYYINTMMPFADVPAEDPDFRQIQAVWGRGLMLGVGSDRFSPETTVTRAQLLTVIYRMEGTASHAPITQAFPDVGRGQWYSKAVEWASDNGIIYGYPDGTFRPHQPVTRQELAAILYRCAGGRGNMELGDISYYYDAAEVSHFAEKPMQWMMGQYIFDMEDSYLQSGFLAPNGTVTRRELLRITSFYKLAISDYEPVPE